MPAVRDLSLQHKLHKLLCRRGHVLEALAERNDGKAHAFQILHHLHSAPAVESNLPDIKPFTQSLDKLLDVSVMDNIALRCHDEALTLPGIIGDVIPLHTEIQCILRHPEIRQHPVFILAVSRRKHEHKSRDIRCG